MRAIALLAAASAVAAGEDWTRFRGPNGSGIASGSGYPIEFGPKKNLLWRTPARNGKSSPVLSGRHVFLTGIDGENLFTQCFDRDSGKLLWERSVPRGPKQIAHRLNHAAANTPVTDGENVYSFFREFGLVSYDPSGALRWKTPLGPFNNSMGLSASPIVAGGSVVLLADQERDGFIAGYDTRNGEMKWKTPRTGLIGWTTPVAYGESGVLTATSFEFNAHSSLNGKALWQHAGLAPALVASPVLAGDVIYAFGYGYDSPVPFGDTLASLDRNKDGKLTPDEYGDDAWLNKVASEHGGPERAVTEAAWNEAMRKLSKPSCLVALRVPGEGGRPQELWRYEKSFVGVVPSPIVLDGVLYVVRNGGILTAFDATTGGVLKAGRVERALDPYSASPVAAEGRLYLASEKGRIAVVRAGREWDLAAVNDMGEEIYATPALSGGRIWVRTAEALYCFGSQR